MPNTKLLVISHACVATVNQLFFAEVQKQFPEIEITILVPSNWPNQYQDNQWKVENHPKFKGKIISLPVAFPGHISLHFYGKGISKTLRDENPDWIYCDEEPWALVTSQIYKINARQRKVPITFHTNQNLKKSYPFPFSWFEQWVYKKSTHAFPVGEEAAHVLKAKGYKKAYTAFPYGIDEKLYAPKLTQALQIRTQHHLMPQNFIFGYLGRLVPEKGLNVLVEAFAKITQDLPDARLWLVGSGPEKASLLLLAQKLNLDSSHFQILPSVPHTQAPEILSCFNTLVLPSLTCKFWKEQFGRIIIEALACGVPVIGSNSGEIPLLLKKIGGGLVVPENNPDALAQAMRQILQDAHLRQNLIDAGQKQVHENYTNTALAKVFVNILKK
jgi:glycosyltransferase involved in cell wall biosynthesis